MFLQLVAVFSTSVGICRLSNKLKSFPEREFQQYPQISEKNKRVVLTVRRHQSCETNISDAPDMLLTGVWIGRGQSRTGGGHLGKNRGMNPPWRVDEGFNPDDTLVNHQRSKYCKSAALLQRRPRWCEETKAAAGSLTTGSRFNGSRCVFSAPLETSGGTAARSDGALGSECPHFDHRHLFSSRMEMRGEAGAWKRDRADEIAQRMRRPLCLKWSTSDFAAQQGEGGGGVNYSGALWWLPIYNWPIRTGWTHSSPLCPL